MFVLLSPPEDNISNEKELLKEMFKNGLEVFHLRKPNYTQRDFRKYLDEIPIRFLNKIALHQFHELAEEYPLKGVHFQELKRRETKADVLNKIFSDKKSKHQTVSTSLHDEKEEIGTNFDYVFLSPVFDSISKKGYLGNKSELEVNNSQYWIGMGGVDTHNLETIKTLNYKGVGVLGGVWSAENPLDKFLELKKEYDIVFG